ncbi:hypothetical protein SESBI_11112 [Sesbania bispinosa]|nr:hypothetical protein SESBI_11112 [Sesbania bispinosa]
MAEIPVTMRPSYYGAEDGKTVIPEKEVINDNSNGDDNDGGGPSIKTNGENPHKVVIVTESSGPEVKGGTSQVGNSAPPQVNNVSFPTSTDLPKSTLSPRKERLKIDPVPIPYSDLYDTLLQHIWWPQKCHTSIQSSPKWYNPAEMCKSYGSPRSLN